MDDLAIPRLLKMIDATHIDPEVMARCREALRLRYRGKTDQALELGGTIVKMASEARSADKRNFAAETRRRTSIGIALLYLAYLRHLSNIPAEQRRASVTGQSALTWLAQDDYHLALAELILARMAWDEEQLEAAAHSYHSVLSRLDKMIAIQDRKHNLRLEKQYLELKESAQQALHRVPLAERSAVPNRLAGEASDLESNALNSTSAESDERRQILDFADSYWFPISLPAELVWPGADLAGIQLIPFQNAEQNTVILSRKIEPLLGKMDFVELDQISIGGKRYQILTPDPSPHRFRMQIGQPYYAFQLASARERCTPGEPCFVLVHPSDRPLPPELPIVIMSSTAKRAWLVESRPTSWPMIIGERQWTIVDGTEEITYNESEVQFAGAAVAVLTLLPALASDSAAQNS